jgi:hypothetical protein
MSRVLLSKADAFRKNSFFVRNLARAYHQKKVPALLLKLDIAKVFDLVSWEYLIEML